MVTKVLTYRIWLIHFVLLRYGKAVVFVEYYGSDIYLLLIVRSSESSTERNWQVVESRDSMVR